MSDSKSSIDSLLEVMEQLRNPDTGCPWDIEQSFETIAPYTIEEAYEVDDAIRHGDMDALKDELGDLLLQVVFHSQMAKEKQLFTFEDVAEAISTKMVRRHPHVFGNEFYETQDEQTSAWEEMKAAERSDKARTNASPSALDGIASNLPALLKALKLQKRAARVGFDWPNIEQVLDKITEETEELVEEYKQSDNSARIQEEFGDLLFVLVNLGRHMKIDSEEALRGANAKFERRFRSIEDKLQEAGKSPETSNLEEMDKLWDQVKLEEKAAIAAS